MKWALTFYGFLASATLGIFITQVSCKKETSTGKQYIGTYIGTDSVFVSNKLDTIIHDTAVVTEGIYENSIIMAFKATGVTLDDTIIGNNWGALNAVQNPVGSPSGQGSFNGDKLNATYYYTGNYSITYMEVFYGTLQ